MKQKEWPEGVRGGLTPDFELGYPTKNSLLSVLFVERCSSVDRVPAGNRKLACSMLESGISSLCPCERHFSLNSLWVMQSTRRGGLVRPKTCKLNRKNGILYWCGSHAQDVWFRRTNNLSFSSPSQPPIFSLAAANLKS